MAAPIFAIGFPGLPEMLILGLIVLILFGTRLPSVMRSLGVGITEFRKGIKGEIDADGQSSVEKNESVIEQKSDSSSESSDQTSRTTSSTTA